MDFAIWTLSNRVKSTKQAGGKCLNETAQRHNGTTAAVCRSCDALPTVDSELSCVVRNIRDKHPGARYLFRSFMSASEG